MGFRRFQNRILFFFLGLLTLVLVVAFLVVNTALTRNARARIDSELEVGSRVFIRLLSERARTLATATKLLSGDYAFKRVCAAGDPATILSALKSYRARIGADAMFVVSPDGRTLADTLHTGKSAAAPFPGLIRQAGETGEASAIVLMNGRAYQLFVVPVLAPEPIAFVGTGFLIDDALAKEIQKVSLSSISFLRIPSAGKWTRIASTLPRDQLEVLLRAMPAARWKANRSMSLDLQGKEYVALVTPIGHQSGVGAVLQRSLQDELRPFEGLRIILYALFIGGLLATVAGGVLIARSVTHPVQVLVEGVRKIEAGDFGHTVTIAQKDEIGELAALFNRMTKGLAERDRVRDLLGKVVSPEIAEELLRKEVVLGGEEREVSILFTDIRNFTGLSERQPPNVVLEMLNTCLTRISAVVERNGGTVDKYIGDGVNVASRLENLTKDRTYNAKIIVSEATLRKANDRYETRLLGQVAVRGRSEQTTIHALLGRSGPPALPPDET